MLCFLKIFGVAWIINLKMDWKMTFKLKRTSHTYIRSFLTGTTKHPMCITHMMRPERSVNVETDR